MKSIDWHTVWVYIFLFAGIIFQAAYPYLNPANPQIENAVTAVLLALVAYFFHRQSMVHSAEHNNIMTAIKQRVPPDPPQPTGPMPTPPYGGH